MRKSSLSKKRAPSGEMAVLVGLVLTIAGILLVHTARAQPCAATAPGTVQLWFPEPRGFVPPLFAPQPGFKIQGTGDRLVHHLHGLGGDGTSWNLVAARTSYGGAPNFPARRVPYSTPPTYYHNGSLADAALDAHAAIATAHQALGAPLGLQPANNLVVAHSLGGVVARKLDDLYRDSSAFQRQFGGVATFGSPHMGAVALHNASPNGLDLARPFVAEACAVLGHPEVVVYPSLPLLRWVPGLDPLLKQTVQSSCGTVGKVFTPFAARDFYRPITLDLLPWSASIQNLHTQGSEVPIVAFYGVEEEPVFWRTAQSFFSLDSLGVQQMTDPFNATDDQGLVNFAQRERDRFDALADAAADRALAYREAAHAWRLAVPLAIYYRKRVAQKEATAAALEAAERWYVHANGVYKMIVGAQEIHWLQDGWWCTCVNLQSGAVERSRAESPDDCEPSGGFEDCHATPRYVLRVFQYESDGMVLAHSAGNVNGAVLSVRLPKTNHQQMRNCTETKDKLRLLYNGQLSNAGFFALPVR
jgi:hypothetical protein